MQTRVLPVKKAIQLLSEYCLLPDDLIIVQDDTVLLVHYKNFHESRLENTNELIQLVIANISEKETPLSIEQLKQMKLNSYNMTKALHAKIVTHKSKQQEIIFEDLTDPVLQEIRYEALQDSIEKLLVIITFQLDKISNKEADEKFIKQSSRDDKINSEEKYSKDIFIHPQEERLIHASLERVLDDINKFPTEDFKVLSRVNEVYNQLTTDKQGYLTVTKQGFFSKFFNEDKPSLKSVDDILSKAEITIKSIKDDWPTPLMLKICSQEKKELLKERFYHLSSFIPKSFVALTELEKNPKNDKEIQLKLEEFKKRVLILGKEITGYQKLIPINIMPMSIIQFLIHSEELIADNASFELIIDMFKLFNDIIDTCKMFPNESVFIRKETNYVKNQLIEEINKQDYMSYITCAEEIAKIGTYEDYKHALNVCEKVSKICEFFEENMTDIRARAIKLQSSILPLFEKVKAEEQLRENEIYRMRKKAEKELAASNVKLLTHFTP